ncbi:MAG: hypothetical protein KDD52_00055 [Bdellovibrionales bacterium]|nr:hypothetical protein [Bdellovibrionales bacterium]
MATTQAYGADASISYKMINGTENTSCSYEAQWITEDSVDKSNIISRNDFTEKDLGNYGNIYAQVIRTYYTQKGNFKNQSPEKQIPGQQSFCDSFSVCALTFVCKNTAESTQVEVTIQDHKGKTSTYNIDVHKKGEKGKPFEGSHIDGVSVYVK